jgi:hypothetical protein
MPWMVGGAAYDAGHIGRLLRQRKLYYFRTSFGTFHRQTCMFVCLDAIDELG